MLKLWRKWTNCGVKCVVVSGLGVASDTLKKQSSWIADYIKDFENYHMGTINLLCSKPIHFNVADIKTHVIKWHDKYPSESFDFIKCTIQHNKWIYDGYVYRPSESPHTYCYNKLEIITKFKVDNLRIGDNIRVKFTNSENVGFALIVN